MKRKQRNTELYGEPAGISKFCPQRRCTCQLAASDGRSEDSRRHPEWERQVSY